MNEESQKQDPVMIAMLKNAAAWNKMQTDLTLDDAMKVSIEGLQPGSYVSAEFVRRSTRGYHHNEDGKLKKLYHEIFQKGFDVVDDCEEAIYRCVKNIDGEGDDVGMVAFAKDKLQSRGQGFVSTAHMNSDGVLSKSYGGINAFNKLLRKHNLI